MFKIISIYASLMLQYVLVMLQYVLEIEYHI